MQLLILCADSKTKSLKQNLRKDIDYSLIKPPVWDFLVKQHGTEWMTEKCCPQVFRKCLHSDSLSYLTVSSFYQYFSYCQNGDIYFNLLLEVTTNRTAILNHCASRNITLPMTLSVAKNQKFTL